MGTRIQNDEKRQESLAKMDEQLKAWSARLDGLVAGYLRAGAQPSDAYHVRIDALRVRQEALQGKLKEFANPTGPRGGIGAFRAGIADDWKALEAGLKDLTR